jgi:hypothetical protein
LLGIASLTHARKVGLTVKLCVFQQSYRPDAVRVLKEEPTFAEKPVAM